jgi:hypothetical protein
VEPSTVVDAAQIYRISSSNDLDEFDLLRDRVVIVDQIRREILRHRTLASTALRSSAT